MYIQKNDTVRVNKGSRGSRTFLVIGIIDEDNVLVKDDEDNTAVFNTHYLEVM